jgi:hypothetical protein
MNKEIMRKAGFSKEVDMVDSKICPFCSKPIVPSEFRDRKSIREYEISGLCQECQDDFYGKGE